MEEQRVENVQQSESAVAPEAVPNIGAEPAPAGAGGKTWLKQLIGVALAAVFLWLAFRDVDLRAVWAEMQTVNPMWIGVLLVSVLLSHWVRAMRWVIMLQPLSEHKISTWNAFCAVMFGYAVNIPIPRGGEVVRVVAISKSERIAWAGVVPTLLIDRLLDFAVLVCMVGLTMVILPADLKKNAAMLVPAGVAMCVATVVGLLLLPKVSAIIRYLVSLPQLETRIPAGPRTKLLSLADQFDQGLRFMSNRSTLPVIGVLSFVIWGFYFLNFYLTILAFGWASKIALAPAFIVWTISSASVIAPTPGCAGTYHIATREALHMVAGINITDAVAFATLAHAVAFLIVPVVVALICYAIQRKQLSAVAPSS